MRPFKIETVSSISKGILLETLAAERVTLPSKRICVLEFFYYIAIEHFSEQTSWVNSLKPLVVAGKKAGGNGPTTPLPVMMGRWRRGSERMVATLQGGGRKRDDHVPLILLLGGASAWEER